MIGATFIFKHDNGFVSTEEHEFENAEDMHKFISEKYAYYGTVLAERKGYIWRVSDFGSLIVYFGKVG